MEAFFGLVISGIFSIIAAYVTATLTTKSKVRVELEKEHKTRKLDVVMKQKYEYFLPFKYYAEDFRGRLIHIMQTLSKAEGLEKHAQMVKRFSQEFKPKPLEWYFNDSIGSEGGYFISSTIYMNCVLFYWMKRIQLEHPFISLKLPKNSSKVQQYSKYVRKEKRLSKIENECDIFDFIKNIRVAIAREKGIPYGLHDSLGDFLYHHAEKRIMNYEEFCEHLQDEKKRIKFLPILNFWTRLVINPDTVDTERLKKISIVIAILDLLKNAEIREQE